MNSTEVSAQLKDATIFNVNLPEWQNSSATQIAKMETEATIRQRQQRQMYIALGVLVVIIAMIFLIRK